MSCTGGFHLCVLLSLFEGYDVKFRGIRKLPKTVDQWSEGDLLGAEVLKLEFEALRCLTAL